MKSLEELLNSMSLEEKAGQMIMTRGLRLFPEETRDLIRRGLLGGIQARSNEDHPDELEAVQALSPVPLLVGADMEEGFHGTAFGGTEFPCQMALGAIGSEDAAYRWAAMAAVEARAYGVNFVFGPVLDVAMDPESPLVNIRSFGSDIGLVIRLGAAAVRGYQEHGMQVAAKHFPGAGRSPVDSHMETARLACTREQFENEELRVFREVIRASRLSGVMSGHILVPAVDQDRISTVSPEIMRQLDRLGFDGIRITDSPPWRA